MAVITDQAFVTLATSDGYGQGALVLGSSLRGSQTTRILVILISPMVSQRVRTALACVFDEIIVVDVMDSRDSAHLALLGRPELGVTFTKLHSWCLIKYTKCVFMDADTLVLNNIDNLFEREELSAAPDPGWPDCFNSGVFVFRPSMDTYHRLLDFAVDYGSFDGGDQGLLNSFFSDWATKDIHKHLPFLYNLSSVAVYNYLAAFKRFGSQAKVIHFLGPVKPWHYTFIPDTHLVLTDTGKPKEPHIVDLLQLWWDVYFSSVMPLFTNPEEGCILPTTWPRSQDSLSTNWVSAAEWSMTVNSWELVKSSFTISRLAMELSQAWFRSSLITMKVRSSKHTKEAKWQNVGQHPEKYTPRGSLASIEECPKLETQIFGENYVPQPDPAFIASRGELGELRCPVTEQETERPAATSKATRGEGMDRRKWEEGHIDYLGKDAFSNIQKKLDQFLQ
uniref:glycogenin glucosyltransferase n=1 Tax=Callorhinchus milii TaxID=7868 RepID=V9KVP1_CALMI